MRIAHLEAAMADALARRGLSAEEATAVAYDYLDSELRGKKTHGVARFLRELELIDRKRGYPQAVISRGAMALVDGNMGIGQIAARYCASLATDKAREHGIGAVGLRNSQRLAALGGWARMMADMDMVGIVMSTCEPAAAPFGSWSNVLGSNPIAIGIPTLTDPIVIDMATTKASMSEIWRCMVEGRKLPPRAFFDGSGGYTRDPARARAAEIFGGYKGYALSLAIQVMSGSLVTAEMGGMIRVPRHIGYYFQAIDPSVFQDIDAFKAANTRLAREIKLSRRKSGVMEVYLPGERGERRRKHALKTGFVELGDGTARMLDRVVGWDDARTYS